MNDGNDFDEAENGLPSPEHVSLTVFDIPLDLIKSHGRDAVVNGIPRHENPFNPVTEQAQSDAWFSGYDSAGGL